MGPARGDALIDAELLAVDTDGSQSPSPGNCPHYLFPIADLVALTTRADLQPVGVSGEAIYPRRLGRDTPRGPARRQSHADNAVPRSRPTSAPSKWSRSAAVLSRRFKAASAFEQVSW